VAGGVFGLLPKILVEYFGARNLPQIYGIVFSVSACGSVVGPPLVGAIIDSYGYLAGSVVAGVCLIVGSGIVFTISFFQKGEEMGIPLLTATIEN